MKVDVFKCNYTKEYGYYEYMNVGVININKYHNDKINFFTLKKVFRYLDDELLASTMDVGLWGCYRLFLVWRRDLKL